MFSPTKPLKFLEFVTLLAFMVSILAMSIDAMLPALGDIAIDLDVENANDTQLVVTSMFLGFALGQILAGPLSDNYGRKPVIYVGYLIFITGCMISMVTESFFWMLFGRMLQGLGAAAPRIVSIALVRDGYEGRAMARIMSVVMAIFILVPAIAPAIGQGMMLIAGWRSIFGLLLMMALAAFFWFALRQPETLEKSARISLSGRNFLAGFKEVVSYRSTFGYTLASGALFSAFIGYLSSAQQIFQTTYASGQWFAIYFGVAALAIGIASVYNSSVVERLGMRFMSLRATIGLFFSSALFLFVVFIFSGVPPLWMLMTWLIVAFFCTGILFGNFNAMAMEPVGHMAGMGAAVVGSLSTLISLPLGWYIGSEFNGTVFPLVAGFVVMSAACIAIIVFIDRKPIETKPESKI
ncbi:MAG: multidrug effflux MFS transporter [Pseudomonadota bacterium]